jgi:parallel beta-helix repeat protein
LEKAAHVTLQNNTFFTFKKFGINVQYSKNITIDGNLVIGVYARHYNSTVMGDVQGNIVACGQLDIDFCWNIRVLNNIVAGLEQSLVDANGYTIMGHECGNSKQMRFRNNTAHSI